MYNIPGMSRQDDFICPLILTPLTHISYALGYQSSDLRDNGRRSTGLTDVYLVGILW